MLAGRTLVFGHRGAKADAPMNTIPAFELALAQGADGIELDVHRSKDGALVIVHDFTVDETTDGEGAVKDMTLAELKSLDAGRWFDARFTGVTIPTLDEVFEAVGNKLYINVEIKSISPETDGIEALVAETITRHNMGSRVLLSSFNPLALRRFRDHLPDVPIGFLYQRGEYEDIWGLMDHMPHEARHPHETMIDAAYMQWARENGFCVNTWTVNDTDRAVALRDLGVSIIISDVPGKVKAALDG